ncbi:hypothetical protein PO124_11020 [Bacillus licheniformis]|nr:hypothetical protein [Bacillus licheniformis]
MKSERKRRLPFKTKGQSLLLTIWQSRNGPLSSSSSSKQLNFEKFCTPQRS